MEARTFREWIRQIYATRDDEIDCDQIFDLLPGYIDLEVSGGNAATRWPQVKHHLSQCAACEDLYGALLEVARLEATGKLPEVAELLRDLEPIEEREKVFAA